LQAALELWPPNLRAERTALQQLLRGRSPRQALAAVPGRLRVLYVNAFQARIFNRLLRERLDEGLLHRLEPGDLAWLHDRGAVFEVGDPEAEQPRADSFEISPSGPLPGFKTKLAGGRPGQREAAALAEAGVSLESFRSRDATRAPGARRPYRVPLRDADVSSEEDGTLRLRFTLGPGSYATQVLAEVMKSDALP
jgi:tRNA pseudouridine13 synthase